MTQTPIQKAIEEIEKLSPTEGNLFHEGIQWAIIKLKQNISYEEEFAREMFQHGEERGTDQINVIDKVEGQVFPDFETLYSKYKKL